MSAPLVHNRVGKALVWRNASVVAQFHVSYARTFGSRLRGLLGQKELSAGTGLLIEPCEAIHTWFMRFSIDCVFLDATNKIKKIAAEVPPWRFVGSAGTAAVFETQAGGASCLLLDDRFSFETDDQGENTVQNQILD